MKSIRKREYIGLIVLVLLFSGLLLPALQQARREKRDGIRREEARNIKTAVEMYFNEYDFYPLEFNAGGHEYVVLKQAGQGASEFYIRAELENSGETAAGFDEEYNIYFRIVNEGGKTFYDICGGELRCGEEET